MADYKKYKVGITVKEPWANDISFEVLDMTLNAVENGGDGCSYVALKDNIGVRPGTDPNTWVKSTQAGQSIYDLAVKYHHFEGTEEEFEAQYQQVLQDARDAATATNATNREVTAAEALRVTAEQGRVSAESGRVSAEAGRVSAESGRVSEWGGMKTDVTTAIGQADAATARANAAAGHAAPYIGENGHWYRWDTTTSEYVDTGEKAVAPVLTADNDGVIYADGTQLTDVLKTTAAAELAQEGTSESVAGDGTRWGAYKAAEASRDTAAQAAEGTSESAAGASNRWGAYKTAEASRDTARQTAEGNSSSVAGDGSRWGAYKTAEAARDTAAASAEGTSSASAGDANRWGAYKTAENARDAARLAAEGTSSSEAGDGTRWGAYKTAEAERSAAMNAKADKDTDAVEGNIAKFDANGNPVDGGFSISDLNQLKLDVEQMILTGNDYMAAGFNPANLTPAASKTLGDNTLIKYGFYLIDTTDNAGDVCSHPMLLKRNSLLRFDNGNFAPVVGITAAMRAECMEHALYDAGGNLVYASGAYDPEDYYANHVTVGIINGVKKFVFDKLTKDDTGVEVSHYLMPWETVETKYTIGFGCGNTIYFLQNAHGTSGLRWNIMSPIAKVFDGCTPQVLKPTLFSPCPTGLISENDVIKTRTFFTLYGGMNSGNAKCNGTAANGCQIFNRTDRTYPAHGGIQQPRNMQWARNNNSDHSKTLPFAEGGWNTLNAFLTYLEIKYGTRDIHGAGLFGSGISSDEPDNNEATFHSHGGCRIRKQGDTDWTYANWNVTPSGVFTTAAGASTNMSNLLNAYAPKETVLESQMAFSFAMEMGVEADAEFEMYGLTYWWEAVPGADIADMSAKVWSQRAGTVNGYDANGDATVFEVEANLRMSLFEGCNLSGDIYWYFGGGVEVVGTNLTAGSGGKSGDILDVYVEPDQENWHSVTGYSLSPGGRFAFEDTMRHVAQFNSLGNFYSRDDVPGLPCGIVSGGGLDSGMCHYNYAGNYWGYTTVGQRARLGLRFRGAASNADCSPRYWYGNSTAGYAVNDFGGSAQVRIAEQGATQTQSE